MIQPLENFDMTCPWCGFLECQITSQFRLVPQTCPSCLRELLGRCCDCGLVIPDPVDIRNVAAVVDGPLGSRLVVHKHCEESPKKWLKWWREASKAPISPGPA